MMVHIFHAIQVIAGLDLSIIQEDRQVSQLIAAFNHSSALPQISPAFETHLPPQHALLPARLIYIHVKTSHLLPQGRPSWDAKHSAPGSKTQLLP